MGIYYDEIQGEYYDDDYEICVICKCCDRLVNEERSAPNLCEKCGENICNSCAENGLIEFDINDNVVCIGCLPSRSNYGKDERNDG